MSRPLQYPSENRYDTESLTADWHMMHDANYIASNYESGSQLVLSDMKKKQFKKKQMFISSTVFWKVVSLFLLITLVGYGILIYFSVMNNIGVNQLKRQLTNQYRGQYKKDSYENKSIVTENIEEMDYFNISCEDVLTTSKLVIFSAIYVPKWDSPICYNDVTNIISRKCSSDNSCLLRIENEIFPTSSCYENIKELVITYTCTTSQYLFGPVLKNADSGGEDIAYGDAFVTHGVGSIEACGMTCLRVPGCVGVVYAPRSDACWFKKRMVERHHTVDRDSMMIFSFQRSQDP